MSASSAPSVALFREALAWLEANYAAHTFFVERDLVWTIQLWIKSEIEQRRLPQRVFNDYPMLPGNRRARSADLVILDETCAEVAEVAAEFKYEPSHDRQDIPRHKFESSVVFWGKDGVAKDVARTREFVAAGKANTAFAIFIDEGGYFAKRPAHVGSRWCQWSTGPWVLLTENSAPRPPNHAGGTP